MIARGINTLICSLAAATLLLPAGLAAQPERLPSTTVPPPNERLYIASDGPVRVTAAVPDRDEAREIFGADLYRRGIQPVWIRIENLGDAPVWFLPYGVDRAYFAPFEVQQRTRARPGDTSIYKEQIRNRVDAGASRSGYVFSRLDEGTKSFNVDVLGTTALHSVSYFIPVPGLRVDHYGTDWSGLYEESEIVDVNLDELIAGLESLPCCVTDKRGRSDGDPLNIALAGDILDVYYAFMRAGWDETETVYGLSLLKMGISALAGNEYRYSPVSPLYVFGRAQDVALQKARTSIDERNHLRLWLTPMRYQGKPVWIGQISRDIGVRFTRKTITTHKIDPDVDETREYLVEDLAYAQSLEALGYVRGVGSASFAEPRGNLTGDPYFTDGLRAVMFIAAEPVDITGVELRDLGAWPR